MSSLTASNQQLATVEKKASGDTVSPVKTIVPLADYDKVINSSYNDERSQKQLSEAKLRHMQNLLYRKSSKSMQQKLEQLSKNLDSEDTAIHGSLAEWINKLDKSPSEQAAANSCNDTNQPLSANIDSLISQALTIDKEHGESPLTALNHYAENGSNIIPNKNSDIVCNALCVNEGQVTLETFDDSSSDVCLSPSMMSSNDSLVDKSSDSLCVGTSDSLCVENSDTSCEFPTNDDLSNITNDTLVEKADDLTKEHSDACILETSNDEGVSALNSGEITSPILGCSSSMLKTVHAILSSAGTGNPSLGEVANNSRIEASLSLNSDLLTPTASTNSFVKADAAINDSLPMNRLMSESDSSTLSQQVQGVDTLITDKSIRDYPVIAVNGAMLNSLTGKTLSSNDELAFLKNANPGEIVAISPKNQSILSDTHNVSTFQNIETNTLTEADSGFNNGTQYIAQNENIDIDTNDGYVDGFHFDNLPIKALSVKLLARKKCKKAPIKAITDLKKIECRIGKTLEELHKKYKPGLNGKNRRSSDKQCV